MLLFHLVCASLLLDTNISNNQCLQEFSLKFTFSPISVRSPSDGQIDRSFQIEHYHGNLHSESRPAEGHKRMVPE